MLERIIHGAERKDYVKQAKPVNVREFSATDKKTGKTYMVRIFDNDKYAYFIDGNIIEEGRKLSEYRDVMEFGNRRVDCICFSCETMDGEGDGYRFRYSEEMGGVLSII